MTILDTPEQINFFVLLSMRSAIRLNIDHGLTVKGRSPAAVAKQRFGLPKSWPKERTYQFVDAKEVVHV